MENRSFQYNEVYSKLSLETRNSTPYIRTYTLKNNLEIMEEIHEITLLLTRRISLVLVEHLLNYDLGGDVIVV